MAFFKSKNELALIELAKRKRDEAYQKSPETWLSKRFQEPMTNVQWSLYPEYDGHEWDGTKDPFLTAIRALAAGRWVGIESATNVGKTYIVPRIVYWFLDVFPNSLVVTTAPKRDQLQKVMWTEMANAYNKFNRIRPFSEMITLNVAVDKRSKKKSDTVSDNTGWEALGIVAGVRAGEDSATKMQGFHRKYMLFIVDETPGVHAAVMTAILNTSTGTHNLVLALGNPDSQIDPLHQFCQLSRTEHIIISALDHPNIVCKRAIIPAAVSQESIDMRKEEYGEESNFYKSRVRGIAPEEGISALIKTDWINRCDKNNKSKFQNVPVDGSANAAGIDVAQSEAGDQAAVAMGRKNTLDYLKEFQCNNATHLAYNLLMDDIELDIKGYKNFNLIKLKDYNIEPKHTGIDGVGIGAATVNAFNDEKFKAVSLVGGELEKAIPMTAEKEKMYRFANLRSQMFFELREDFRTESIILDLEPKLVKRLIKELIAHDYKIQGGKVVVESKIDIKKKLGGKSPNLADAVAYWNWMRKNYYTAVKPLPFSTGGK